MSIHRSGSIQKFTFLYRTHLIFNISHLQKKGHQKIGSLFETTQQKQLNINLMLSNYHLCIEGNNKLFIGGDTEHMDS